MATVRVQPLGQAWEVLGVDRCRGIHPEALTLNSDGWGPSTATFTLARPLDVFHPDLQPFTPVEIELPGFTWEGFVSEVTGQGDKTAVSCRGWQHHLDDDPFERAWVHWRQSDWYDTREGAATSAPFTPNIGNVGSQSGGILIGWAKDDTVLASTKVGVTLDLAVADAKRITLHLLTTGVAGQPINFEIRGHDLDNGAVSASEGVAIAGPGTGFQSCTFTTRRRYVSLILANNTGTTFTAPGDITALISIPRVYRQTAYEVGNGSVLTPVDVVKDCLVKAPLLSQDTSLIDPDELIAYTLGELAPPQALSPRDHMEAVNQPLGWKLSIRQGRKLSFAPSPTAPTRRVGGGAELGSLSLSVADWVYSDVSVEGEDRGRQLRVYRSQPDGSSVPQRRGFVRRMVLETGSGDESLLEDLGDTFLADHKHVALRGPITVPPGELFEFSSGQPLHPSRLLGDPGELLELPSQIDPHTGAIGRSGRIVSVSYDDDDETAVAQLDNSADSFSTLLSAYGAG